MNPRIRKGRSYTDDMVFNVIVNRALGEDTDYSRIVKDCIHKGKKYSTCESAKIGCTIALVVYNKFGRSSLVDWIYHFDKDGGLVQDATSSEEAAAQT